VGSLDPLLAFVAGIVVGVRFRRSDKKKRSA
jgi:hypothetical protein